MGIGSVLLQPQRIRRSTGLGADSALIDDLMRTVTRLMTDPEEAQNIARILAESIQETAGRFQDRVSGRLEKAYGRLENMLKPITGYFQGIDFSSMDDDPERAMQQAERILEMLSDVLGSLTLDNLRQYTTELIDIFENDLGITGGFIEDETWAFVDGIITRIEQVPDTAGTETREKRLDIAALLRRAKRRARQEFEFPKLDAEKLARLLLDLLRSAQVDDLARKVKCVADGLGSAVDAASSINKLVWRSTHKSLGAAASDGPTPGGRYLWYASWLLGYKYRDIPLFGLSDLKEGGKPLASRLKTPAAADVTSRFIVSRLSEDERSAVNSYDGNSKPKDDLNLILVACLDRLIQERSLLDQEGFGLGNTTLSEYTREVGESYVKDRELVRYNRMILEDIYPNELEQLSRSGGGRFWSWVWEQIRQVSGWPGEQARVSKDGKYVMLDDKILHSGTTVKWQDAPIFNTPNRPECQKYYSFEHIPKEFLEGWAWHSAWGTDTIRTLWHLLYIMGMGRAHFVPYLLNGVYDVTHGLFSGIARKPFSGFEFFSHKWLEWSLGAPLALTTAGSPQGAHTEASFGNRLAFWFTVYMGDISNYAAPISATSTFRNLPLSVMTLINFGGPKQGPSTMPPGGPLNNKEVDGVVDPVALGFTYWLASYVKREEYVHPFMPSNVPGKVWGLWLGGGIGMGLFAGFAGALIAEILAWAEDWALLGWTMLKAIPKVLVMFWPIVYGLREGDTDDGRFNPAGGPDFLGYPTKDTPSPYLLPYPAGRMVNVGQANAGVWSHNPRANGIHTPNPATLQTYAYDFALDQDEEILASRGGTVVAFFDGTPNDTTGAWNHVRIRHDLDANGNAANPDPAHDRDAGGGVTRTFAEYGHGRQGSVTGVFRARPNSPAWPIPLGGKPPGATTIAVVGGQVVWIDAAGNQINDPATGAAAPVTVRQGQPVMLAGDTGTSFYNHLHMHVLPGSTGPASANANTTYTIPFIFQDVGGDGVCGALTWHESQNTRIP